MMYGRPHRAGLGLAHLLAAGPRRLFGTVLIAVAIDLVTNLGQS